MAFWNNTEHALMPQQFDVAIRKIRMSSEESDVHGAVANLLDVVARIAMTHVDRDSLVRTRKLYQ